MVFSFYFPELNDFRNIAEQFITIASNYAELVDKQKMKAIGAQNMLKTFSKEKESEQLKMQSAITEKTQDLERLKLELQYLQRIEAEQQEVIDNFYQNQ